ncbi:hypothetical protein H9P43_004673 [Blastocladiella emersonii ATCC 22665]|nr:hypothetical protein H9P43_004673 [Blastocladiella emersonii ATCC 22665]
MNQLPEPDRDDSLHAFLRSLLSRDAFAAAPLAWLAFIAAVYAAQQALWAWRPRSSAHHHGYAALEQSEDLDDHAEPRDASPTIVPSTVETLVGAAQALAMAAFLAWALVLTPVLDGPLVYPLAAAWAGLTILTAAEVVLRRRPTSPATPPAYLHISRGFVIGGFLVASLNSALFRFFDAYPDPVADTHAVAAVALAGILLAHTWARRSSYVDLPGAPRFPAASMWECLTLRWMWPTVRRALRVNRLELHDCADFLPEDVPANALAKYNGFRALGYSVGWAAVLTVRRDILLSLALGVSFIMCGFIAPFAMNQFLQFLERRHRSTSDDIHESLSVGYAYCVLLLAGGTLRLLTESHCYLWARITAFRVMGLFNALIGRALLDTTHPVTNAVSLAAGDARKLCNAVGSGASWAFLPLRIVIAVVALVQIMGPLPVAAGAAIIAVSVPLNMWIARRIKLHQRNSVKFTDSRLAVSAQAFEAIRLLKTQVWEARFNAKIEAERTLELQWILSFLVWSSMLTLLAAVTPMAVTVVAFLAHAVLHPAAPLPPADVFTALYLFNMLEWPMRKFPEMYSRVFVVGRISWDRISAFLAECYTHANTVHRGASPNRNPDSGEIGFDACRIERPASGFALDLDGIRFPRGKLSVIVGELGTGKTSTLLALLGELPVARGVVHFPRDAAAFVSQTVFVVHGTLRENIVFGRPWDPARFADVIDRCALAPDIARLPMRDLTVIGSAGLKLSGGTRQRVALARALYSDAPVILADSVLSAVDNVTSNYLYQNALVAAAKRDGKTVILVSHAVALAVKDADYVLALAPGGRIAACGPPESVVLQAGLLQHHPQQQARSGASSPTLVRARSVDSGDDGEENEDGGKESGSVIVEDATTAIKTTAETPLLAPAAPQRRPAEEQRSEGAVQRTHYLRYLGAFGMRLAVASVTLNVAVQALNLRADLTLKEWSASAAADPRERLSSSWGSLTLFALLKLASAVTLGATLTLLFVGSHRASKSLHRALLAQLLAFPTDWFDDNSIGRVINRLSKDLSNVDTLLVPDVNDFVSSVLSNATSLAAVALASPTFLLLALPLVALYAWLGRGYLRVSRDVRRMTNTFYSPVLQHMTEFQAGAGCIRAFAQVPHFTSAVLARAVADAMRPYVSIAASNRWLMVLGDFVAAMLCFAIGIGFLVSPGAEPAWAGFALHYALVLAESVRSTVTVYSLVEVDMSSVERVGEMLALPTERAEGETAVAGWPAAGPLDVVDLHAAYARREGDAGADGEWQDVLHGLTFHVPRGSRVTVLGRTGSGKTSMSAALLRMVPHYRAARMQLGGFDLDAAEVHHLRSQFGCVNQENHLFRGSLRANLDPTGTCLDGEMQALLDAFPRQLPFTLDHEVGGTSSLSKGQAQLVGLLRSMLGTKRKGARVFLCDEPTSAIDHASDKQFWAVFRSYFGLDKSRNGDGGDEMTVIMIAHRITTLVEIECDLVLVMDAGRIIEMGHPRDLLLRQNGAAEGAFARLVREAGDDDEAVVLRYYGVGGGSP